MFSRAHSSSLNGRVVVNMSAWRPSVTVSTLTPARCSRLAVTGLPPSTPMEPVSVPGCATIASAAMAMKYPPEAATSAIDTTTGVPAARARTTSRQIVSDAT